MSAPPRHPGPSEPSTSPEPWADEAWFEALAGRSLKSGGQPAGARADQLEGRALRRTLLALASEAPALAGSASTDPLAADRAAHDRQREAMMRRLRQEGLLVTPSTPNPASAVRPEAPASTGGLGAFMRRWLQPDATNWRPSLAAGFALVMAAVLLVPMLKNEAPVYDEPPAARGAVQTVTRDSSGPRADAESLQAVLRAAGIAAGLYQEGAVFIIDYDLPAEPSAEALSALKAQGLPSSPGWWRIRLQPR